MISSEVQRTLVKSPPELWAEISDPEALARHLGEFGEIRITRVQPEQKVEWEAPDASGSIVIKPSGWGTKVKLTVTRELGEPGTSAEPDAANEPEQASEPAQGTTIEPAQDADGATALELETEAEGEPEPHDEFEAVEPQGPVAASLPLDELEGRSESDPSPETAVESDPQPQEPEQPERRPGFFARLFGRRRGARAATYEPDLHTPEIAKDEYSDPAPAADDLTASDETLTLAAEVAIVEAELDAEPAQTPAIVRSPVSITPATPAAANASEAADRPEPNDTSEHPSSSDAGVAAEVEQTEAAAEEQVTAVLTGVLDRLGAAHHRPFSRA
jgi:hypothetical protein